MTKTMTKKLTQDVYTYTIHGITGRLLDGGVLERGALVRDIQIEQSEEGVRTTFLASTDGGAHWYRQETTGRVSVR